MVTEKSMKATYWTAAAFYLLIVLEFFYMASPFALYFYSGYKPGLAFFYETPALAWLPQFFLPHVVIQTSSPFINLHNPIGAALAVAGLLAFCIGAGQVYYAKLMKKGPVTGGIYNLIRHPQYASLIVCSLGLLLLWPRYIVLVSFVTMVFAYYLLARIEEKECEEKFGRSYRDYKDNTNMFLPFGFGLTGKLPGLPTSKGSKALVLTATYFCCLLGGIMAAKALEAHALNNLYARYSQNSAYVSVTKMDDNSMQKLITAAVSNKEVQQRLSKEGSKAKFLNYILPADLYVSEIPMNAFEGQIHDHFLPRNLKVDTYKIIFTRASLPDSADVEGSGIVRRATGRTPLVEVWLDAANGHVLKVLAPPATFNYEGIPMPVI